MSKICSIIPQVANSTRTSDSKLFVDINSHLKAKGASGVELRNLTKDVYEFMQSPDVTNIIGDWKLYRDAKFGVLTSEDEVRFNSLYNGDITSLEQTVSLNHLNDLLEPKFDFPKTSNLVQETDSLDRVTNKQFVTFDSNDSISEMADRLHISADELKEYILSTGKSIYLKQENSFYTLGLTQERVAPPSDSFGALFGINSDSVNDAETFNPNTIASHNVEVLSDNYEDAEIIYLNKLVSAIIVDDFDSLKEMFIQEESNPIQNYLQVERINKFITTKVNSFKNTIVESIIDKTLGGFKTSDDANEVIAYKTALKDYRRFAGKNKSKADASKRVIDKFKEDNKDYARTINVMEARVNKILESYEAYLKEFLLVNPTTGERSFVYRSFISHARKHYGISIQEVTGLAEIEQTDAEGNSITETFLVSTFNDRDALRLDLKKNVAQELKFLLAQSINTNIVANVVNNLDTNSKYGVKEPISIDDVWNMFISVAVNNRDMQSIITELALINKTQLNGVLDTFVDKLSKDEKIQASFYASVKLSVIPNKTVSIATTHGGNLIVSNRINNYNAFAENIAYQQIRSAIQFKFENDSEYLQNSFAKVEKGVIVSDLNKYDGSKSVEDNVKRVVNSRLTAKEKYDWITARLANLGIDSYVSINDFDINVQSRAGVVSDIKNPLSPSVNPKLTNLEYAIEKAKQDGLTERVNSLRALNNTYLSQLDNIVAHLTRLTANLYQMKYGTNDSNHHLFKRKGFDNLTKKQKASFKFRDLFDSNTSLQEISYLTTLKNYSNTSFSYMNENGDMEQSPQHPSYLTTLLDVFTPTNGVISYALVKEKLAHILVDPLYATNDFIYDYNGNGLLNIRDNNNRIQIDSNTGIPIVNEDSPINPNFVKSFERHQFSGMKFRDTGIGTKYESITGDNWKMMELVAALKGEYIIPSSDSSRSFSITNSKFGLKNFLLDSDGKYKAHRDIFAEMGMIDKDGNIKTRTVEDLKSDDAKICLQVTKRFKDENDELISETSDFVTSIGKLKDIAALDKVVLEKTREFAKILIIAFNRTAFNSLSGNQLISLPSLDKEQMRKFVYADAKGNITEEVKQLPVRFIKNDSLHQVVSLIEKGEVSDSIELYDKAIKAMFSYMMDTSKVELEDDNYISKFMYSDASFGNMTTVDSASVMQQLIPLLDSYSTEKNENLINTLEYTKSTVKVANKYLNNLQLILDRDKQLKDSYQAFLDSKQIKAVRRSIETEILAMQKGLSDFDFEYEWASNGKVRARKATLKVKPEVQEAANKGRLSAPMQFAGKYTKEKVDSKTGKVTKGKAILLDKGLPTGQVFKFHRLSYIDANNNKITLDEFAKKYLGNTPLLHLVARMNINSHPLANKVVAEDVWNTLSDSEQANAITYGELIKDVNIAKHTFENIFQMFLDNYFKSEQERLIDYTKPISQELMIMVVDNIPAYVPGTYEGKGIFGKRVANLISTHLESRINKELVDKANKEAKELENTTDEEMILRRGFNNKQVTRQYNRAMLEASLNNYISSVNIGEDLLYGRQFEYKGFNDVNKRANETFKNGKSNNSNETFASVTIGDVWTASNMLKDLSNGHNGMDVDTVMKRYEDAIEVGNGLSMITVDEYVKRLKAINMYDGKLQEYIEDMSNPDTVFDSSKYSYIAEQLKYFLYTRKTVDSGTFKGSVMSYQEKNSTIVLFPKMFNATKWQLLYDWMAKHDINELNFLSGSKVGGQPIYTIHDSYKKTINGKEVLSDYSVKAIEVDGKVIFDDRIDRSKPYSDSNIEDMTPYKVVYKYSDLRVQQETVSHIMEEKGTIATQMTKKIDVNMNDNDVYQVRFGEGKDDVVEYKGRTHDALNRGIFENRQHSMSFNAEQDRDRLIAAWGGIENGEIKYDENGNIAIDVNSIRKSVQEYQMRSGDVALSRAFEPSQDNLNEPLLSFNHPTLLRAIESLLQAKISDNVKQQLKQIHAPIFADVFIQPMLQGDISTSNHQTFTKEQIVTDYKNNGTISYSSKYIAAQEKSDSPYELKSHYVDEQGVFHPAEIITNIWDSRFEQYRKKKTIIIDGVKTEHTYIDIDEIPEESLTMVGTRIPHEGMQSAFVCKVVGFLNNSSSQIIVPKHLSKTTGWDYDIDTVYIYPKTLYKRASDNRLHPVSYEYDTKYGEVGNNKYSIYNTRRKQLLEYVKLYYNKDFAKLETAKQKAIFDRKEAYLTAKQNILDRAKNSNAENFVLFIKDKSLTDDKTFAMKVEKLLSLNGITGTDPDIAALQNYLRAVNGIEDVKSIDDLPDNIRKFYNENTAKGREALERYVRRMSKTYNTDVNTYKENLNGAIQAIAKDLELSKEEVEALIEPEIDGITKYFPISEVNVGAEIKAIKSKFKADIKEILENYDKSVNDFINSKKVTTSFDALPELKRMTRETRDNMVVDALMARISAASSAINRDKPNEYGHLKSASDYINAKFGLSDKTTNFANLIDRINVANMNRDVSVLKAQSVSNDNIMALFGTLQVGIDAEQAIPVVVMKHEFKTEDEYEIRNALDKAVGNGNYIVDGDRYILFARTLGNSVSGDWKNILGEGITEQSSEITANILDAVKDVLGHKINQTTLNVLTVLANLPIAHNTSVFSKDGSKQSTVFGYSNLIIHQPIISEFITQINLSKRSGEYADKNNAFRTIRNNVQATIIDAIYRMNLATTDNVSDGISILDLYSAHLGKNLDVATKKELNIKAKIDSWIKSLREGKTIYMYENTGISADVAYSELLDFIKKNDVKEQFYTYVDGKYSGETASKLRSSFENSKIADKLAALNITTTSESLFTINKKPNGSKYIINNSKAIKSIDELNEVYTKAIDKKYYNMFSYYENADKSNVEGLIDFANFLDDQLAIAKMYEQVDNVGNLMNKSALVLRTDKLGTSPNSTVSTKLFDDLSNLYIDSKAFERELRDVFKFNTDELNTFKNEYHFLRTIGEREEYINSVIAKLKEKGTTDKNDSNGNPIHFAISEKDLQNYEFKKVPIYAKGVQLAEAIFPSVIRTSGSDNLLDENYDFTKSVYPYFEAQYVYANHFSGKVFGDILLSEKPAVKSLINILSARLNINTNIGATAKANIVNRILNTIINEHIFENVPFFNGGTNNEVARQFEILRVLGKVETDVTDENYVDSVGNFKTSDVETFDANNESSIDLSVLKNIKALTLGKYKTFSAAYQVLLLKEALGKFNTKDGNKVSDINDIESFLNLFEVSLTRDSLLANGYHRISVKDSSFDSIKLQQVFRKMFFNTNPFVRQTARDLIRYTFHTTGLRYGNNMAKYVDMGLYYKEYNDYANSIISEQEEPETNRLYHYNNALKGLENKFNVEVDNTTIEKYLTLIRTQMYDDNVINPLIDRRRKTNKDNIPTWDKHLTLGDEHFPIIVESLSKVANSRYANAETIKTNFKKFDNFPKSDVVFQRYIPANSTEVYYYPISKSLAFEFGTASNGTVIEKYKQYIKPASYYRDIINRYDVGRTATPTEETTSNVEMLFEPSRVITTDARGSVDGDYKYSNVITKSKGTYSETAKVIIDGVDSVVYIGNNDIYKRAFASDKTIYTTIDKLGAKTLESIPFTKATKIAFVGDSLSDMKMTQAEVDKVVVNAIRNYKLLYPIDSVKTIFKKGVGEAVYKATMTNNDNNEYIEVGEKDVVHNVEALSSEASAILQSSTFDMEDVIKRETEIFTTISRIYDFAKGVKDSKADTFRFDIKALKQIAADMRSSEAKGAALIKALDVNMEMVDKVLEYLHYDTIKFANGENVSLLELNILKYVSSDNTSNKIEIANRLLAYNNYLKAAKQVMNIRTITLPSVEGAEFESLSDDEKQYIREFRQTVITLKERISNMQNSLINDSRGVPMTFGKTIDANNTPDKQGISRRKLLEAYTNRIDAKTKEYFAAQVIVYSRNPKFKNTNFAKTVELILEGKIDKEGVITNNISPTELTDLYNTMLNYNDDLTFAQLWLDSIRDTGIPIIDNTMTLYGEIRFNSLEQRNAKLKRLESILEAFPQLKTFGTSLNHNPKREAYIRGTFIDPETGTLIAEYNWSKFYADEAKSKLLSKAYSEFYESFQKGAKATDIQTDYVFAVKEVSPTTNRIELEVKPGRKLTTQLNKYIGSFGNLIKVIDDVSKYTPDMIRDVESQTGTVAKANYETVKHILSNKIVHPSLDNNYNYYKVATYTIDGTERDIIIRLNKDNSPVLVLGKLLYSSPSSKNIFTNYKNEYVSLDKISSSASGTRVNNVADATESTLAIRDIMSDEDAQYHIEQFFAQGLGENSNLRYKYERRHGIEFRIGMDYSISHHNAEDGKYSNRLNTLGQTRDTIENPTVYRLKPIDKYKTAKYTKLKEDEKKFLTDISEYIQDVIYDTLPNRINSEDFLPYIFIQANKTLGATLKEFVGYRAIQKEHIDVDILGNPQNYFQSRSLTAPEIKDLIKIGFKDNSQSYSDFEKEVVERANKQLEYIKKDGKKAILYANVQPFKTLDDIYAFNDALTKEFNKANQNKLVYDLPSLLNGFVEEMYNLKSNVDFESSFSLMKSIVDSDDFKVMHKTHKGLGVKDIMASVMGGHTTFATRSGTNTNASKRLPYFSDILHGVSRTQTRLDQILGVATRYTSMNVMWFNYHTGIKNVMKGVSDIMIESIGNEFYNRKELGSAMNEYRTNVVNMLACSYGNAKPTLTTAIIARYHDIYEDHTEGKLNKQTGTAYSKVSNAIEAMGYAAMTGGEHFVQMTSLLAIMKSHRVVNGQIMSRDEYVANRKNDIIKENLTQEQKDSLNAYVEKKNSQEGSKYRFTDHVQNWFTYNISKIDATTLAKIHKEIKAAKYKAIGEFEGLKGTDGKQHGGFPTVMSYFELKDGEAIPKEGFTKAMETKLSDRVQGLNQSIHGIYNTIDRNALQATLFGEVLFQFRKWMRPTWVRWMGSNYSFGSNDRSQFSERLGTYRSGAFVDFMKFMKTPYVSNLYHAKEAGEKNPALNAMINTIKHYHTFLSNAKIYYSALSSHEQANIRRTLGFMAALTASTVLLVVASAGFADDDDKKLKDKARLQLWAINEIAGLQTEYSDMLPIIGWYKFYARTKRNAVPVERQIGNTVKLMEDAFLYPIRDEENNIYQRGQYKGESKLKIDIEKAIPIWRQWHKELYLESSINYYNMYNPTMNIFK